MPAVATGRSSEGDESVKAEEGPLETTSIAAPARAPSTPPETRRESMLSSMTPQDAKLWLLAAEHGLNVLNAERVRPSPPSPSLGRAFRIAATIAPLRTSRKPPEAKNTAVNHDLAAATSFRPTCGAEAGGAPPITAGSFLAARF
jgi:hypothetical protein